MASSLDRVFALPPFSELRVVTSSNPKDRTIVTLQAPNRRAEEAHELRGTALPRADVLGSELVPGVGVQLPMSRSLPVFTPTGCTLAVAAPPAVLQRCYVTTSGAVWMRSLLSLHSHLEVQRMEAKQSDVDVGPRVLVVSEERFTGASTYVRMLSAYAVRLGYHPLLLDGAVDHPRFGFPGCVSLYHLQYTLDVEEETAFLPGVQIFAGGERSKASEGLYMHGVQTLVQLGLKKMGSNDRCRVGGLFLDYGTVSTASVEAAEREEEKMNHGDHRGGDGALRSVSSSVFNPLDLLIDTIIEAEIDHVLVVQSGWLRYKLAQRVLERFSLDPLAAGRWAEAGEHHLLSAPTEVACESLGSAFKLFLVDGLDHVSEVSPRVTRHQRWMHYFFGTPTSALKPTVTTVVARIVSVGSSQQSALAEMMPMVDEGTTTAERDGYGGTLRERDGGLRSGGVRKVDPAAVNFVRSQDVELKGRIVGISSATAMEEMPDGSLREVDYTELERRVQECVLVGFAFVESVNGERVTLLVNDVGLREDLGVCLVLMDEFLTR